MGKYLLYAVISGLLMGFAWPTNGWEVLIFVAWVPLLLSEHHIAKFSSYKYKGWRVFVVSFVAFFVWNIVATGWLYQSKNPDGSHSVFAVLVPVFMNALFMGLVFQTYYAFKKIMGTYWSFPYLILVWMCFEKLHLEWELSWPWLNLGNVFSEKIQWIQWYEYTGSFGGTLWVLVVNLLFFYTIRVFQASRQRKNLIKNSSLIAVVILFPILVSKLRFHFIDLRPIGQVKAILLQPAVDPYTEKYSLDSLRITQDLLEISQKSFQKKEALNADLIIAPETALPGSGQLNELNISRSKVIGEVQHFLKTYPKTSFITGVSTYREFSENDKPATAFFHPYNLKWVDFYNSVLQLNATPPLQIYHKSKLVPGAEIFPYKSLLQPLLGNLMLDFGGVSITLGTENDRKVFRNPYNKAVIAPIVCYESIYGEFVARYVQLGANILSVSTNDSWWGVSQGHKQLMSYARLRAIETRRDILRSANSGVSTHINYKGEVIKQMPYLQKGALITEPKLYDGQTFYVKYGDLLVRFSLLLLGVFWAIGCSKIILGKK